MSQNPNVEKAANIVSVKRGDSCTSHQIAQALAAAGLLVTPEMQEACEALAAYIGQVKDWNPELHSPEWVRCINAGRALLASEPKRERWHAICLDGIWRVEDDRDAERLYKCAQNPPRSFTEAEAKAIAKALNEVQP